MKISLPVFMLFLAATLALCSCGPFGVVPLLGAAAGGGGGGGGGGAAGPGGLPNPTLVLRDQSNSLLTDHTNSYTVDVDVTGVATSVTHYILDETTSGKPEPTDSGWLALPIPTTHTFSTTGLNTLYLWVKNDKDLVNPGTVSADITVDLTPPMDPSLTLYDQDTMSTTTTDDPLVDVDATNIDADVDMFILSETHSTTPAEDDAAWDYNLPVPDTFMLSAGEALKTVYLWVKDYAGNICANPGMHQIAYNTSGVADPIFHLEDLTSGRTQYSNSTTVAVVGDSIDVDATYYLLSESQATQPDPGDLGWTAMPLPATFDLGGTGSRTVYLWLMDDLNGINVTPTYAEIFVDTTPPADPSLTLTDQLTGSTDYTASSTVNVSTSNIDADVSQFIMTETIYATQPAEDDASWTNLPIWSVYALSSGDGTHTVYLWVKDDAGNICVNPGQHNIELDTQINDPSFALEDQDSGSQSWSNGQTVDVVNVSVDADVVEYIISETITSTPNAAAPEWNSTQPIAYTLDNTTEEVKTVHLWVKDDAGNIAGSTATISYDESGPTAWANPVGGSYVGLTSITLAATDNMDPSPAIYFTTNGLDPDTGSTPYTAPINLTLDTTIKFIAYDAAGNQSGIYQEDYVVTLMTTYVATTGDDVTGNGTAANPYWSIQKGLDTAKTGTTVIVQDGTYASAANRNLEFAGKEILLKSSGGAANCIIDCESSGRGFYFHSGETSNSVVNGFTIQSGSASDGAGVYCTGSSPTITRCVIWNGTTSGGSGYGGGGISCRDNSNPTITDCTVNNNTGNDSGGGIACWSNSNPQIVNCAILSNYATANGGGIFCSQSSPTITNCLIADNAANAGSGGGGILCGESSPVLTNCTIANNQTNLNDGGGINCQNSAAPVLYNTIIWGNDAPSTGDEIYTDGTSNVTLDSCDYLNKTGDVNGTVSTFNCTNEDPEFRSPGAPSYDYRLKCGSLCFDRGDNSVITWSDDLDGNARIMGRAVDIGAYELNVIRVPSDQSTIQEGINSSNDWDVILVADGRYTGVGNRDIDMRGYLIAVRSEFGPEGCVVDCQGSPSTNARGFYFAAGESSDTVLEGIKIVNGYVEEGGTLPGTGGGGIYCDDSSPTIRRCIIEDCQVLGTNSTFGYGCGGGICCTSTSHPVIMHCQISWNYAQTRGGGIFCHCSLPGGDILKIFNCLITNNTGEEDAGGIFIWGNTAPNLCYCDIYNCTITGNDTLATGLAGGGGIFACANASIKMTNSIVWNNYSAAAGNEDMMVYSTADSFNIICCDYDPTHVEDPGSVIAGSGNIALDPLFLNPADSEYHLHGGSPCIGTGENGYVSWNHDLDVIHSERRKRIWGSDVDMGCYEGAWLPVPESYPTIQSAINAATDGDMVPVASGTYTGAGNKDLTFSGKNIILLGAMDSGDCIIDCEGSGRGMYFNGGEGPDTIVIGFTIKNGYVGTGGAIACSGSSPTILNCAMIGNESTSFGGAVHCNNAGPTLINCLMNGNDTGTGGTGGGAFYNFSGSKSRLINCTIVNNNSQSSGGGIRSHSSAQSLKMKNCIVWGNTAASGATDIASEASTVKASYSCVNPTGCSGVVWETGNLFVNPEFAQNGGGHLKKNSPCLDMGDSSAIVWNQDLDSKPRLLGSGIDMGCFEGSMLVVPVDYSYIQDAIDAASDYDIVLVEDGSYTAALDKNLDPGGKSLWIVSRNGPASCAIDCQNSGRGFYFHSGEDDSCVVKGFTIQNGSVTGSGGGILCQSSSPSIQNCVIVKCGSSANGAGISCENGASPEIWHCTIQDNNSGGSGGGIRATNYSHPTVVNSLVANNFCVGVGAGVSFDTGCDAEMTNCTIANNESNGNGAGLYMYQNHVTLDNCILWGNLTNGSFAHTIMKAGAAADTYLYMNNCCYPTGTYLGISQISGGGSLIPVNCLTADQGSFPNYPDFNTLGSPGVSGGGDFHIAGSSPCIDMGDNGFVFWAEDLDGGPRIMDGGSGMIVDMGAYER